MGQPPLILSAELTRSIDAAHSHDCAVQAVDARVISYILVGGSLGASIGTIEIERCILGNSGGKFRIGGDMPLPNPHDLVVGDEAAVNFVGGCEDHRRRSIMKPDCFQDV